MKERTKILMMENDKVGRGQEETSTEIRVMRLGRLPLRVTQTEERHRRGGKTGTGCGPYGSREGLDYIVS